jgi:hypothetical protein
MEKLSAEKKLLKTGASITAILGIAGAALFGFVRLNEYQDPQSTFIDMYTQKGGCLDQTPFDPDEGAIINVYEIEDQQILSTTPKAANSYDPSVLFFTVGNSKLFSRPDFHFADNYTGKAVTDFDCKDQDGGY